ncbi:MAG TPA: PHP domain-containing protein [Chloroflexi bacterium]|nr:PHP domain-containing protein [Chloroflexota bacterium]
MREHRADLHLHTLLSACAEVEMIPPLMIEEALYKGLQIIAVTDHNSCGNAGAVMEAAQGTELVVLPGMELQSQEEVDLVCLFDTLEQAEAWQAQVDARLLPLQNDPERFGPQYLVDATGKLVAEETNFLQGAAQIPLAEAVASVHTLGGLAIPAHIDRPSKGLLRTLGLWPSNLQVEAAELSPNMRPSQARQRYPFLPDIPLITASDAHWLDAIGQVMTVFVLKGPPCIAELRAALRGEEGRRMFVP